MKPKRIQRNWTKGWTMPPNTLFVGRPSVWGNPINIYEECFATPEAVVAMFERCIKSPGLIYFSYELSVANEMFPKFEYIKNNLHKLRGKNLACFCKLGAPCHADILLKLANK